MAITRISRVFKDISLSFKRHPVTNDIGVLKNADAIKRSVRNLVQTIPSERFFNSTLGSDVRDSLFENSPGFVDFGTASIIERQIQTTIENFEPRIDNLEINVNPRPDSNEFEINVFFDIIGQTFPAQEFSFILKATR
jgi:predicted component of type VI protein secretion system